MSSSRIGFESKPETSLKPGDDPQNAATTLITAQLEAEAMDNRVMVEASSRTTAEAKELHGLLQRTREDCNRAHARATQSLLDQESISDELREAKVNPKP